MEDRERSIPVHTGKPHKPLEPPAQSWVYPRTHGETKYKATPHTKLKGLSPYTRGNPEQRGETSAFCRSIPVHTGKPGGRAGSHCSHGVYPRTHGETISPRTGATCRKGLSPYTRGNPYWICHDNRCERSIPVHTGKPRYRAIFASVKMVYPRTHGETCSNPSNLVIPKGLSPYTRGNPGRYRSVRGTCGSIPVHTGKPGRCSKRAQRNAVYPRTHGETFWCP